MLYQKILKPLLFQLPPEVAHQVVLKACAAVGYSSFLCDLLAKTIGNGCLEPIEFCGINFPNRVGVAAGFDKNCEAVELMSALGFGHVEIGTVTNQPQFGNDRPRLWRLPQDEALINKLGFPSAGSEYVLAKLQKLSRKKIRAVVGVNIGKNKIVPIDEAVEDYAQLFNKLKNYGDYFVLNVSSPNTPELRKLQEPERLANLFAAIHSLNIDSKPILVKLAPDLSQAELKATVETCLSAGVSGLIVSNTTFARDGLSRPTNLQGGLSGKPLFPKALACLQQVVAITGPDFPIIAVGGISSRDEYEQVLAAGAKLVQVYTAMVYQGPGIIDRLLAK